jgi:hypothetical protein
MTVEDFLKPYDLNVQAICLDIRKLATELLPGTEEILFEGWKNFAYGTGESRATKDLIIYIAPFKDSVNLGFYHGANLADKKKLLKGTGKLLRHLKLRSMKDYEIDEIKELITEAKIERLGKE